MKLLAQFYACLAIIVFIAVIGGIDAHGTDADNHGGLETEHHAEGPHEKHNGEHNIEKKVRRSAPDAEIKNPSDSAPKEQPHAPERHRRDVPKPDGMPEMPEGMPQAPQRHRRQAPNDHDKQEKPHADAASEEQYKRVRRQMPNPDDMAKQIPAPGRK